VAVVDLEPLIEGQRVQLLERNAQLHVDEARRDGRAEDGAMPEVAGQTLVVCERKIKNERSWKKSAHVVLVLCDNALEDKGASDQGKVQLHVNQVDE
jgi:hypothetical protein